jgi:hypothetical protein
VRQLGYLPPQTVQLGIEMDLLIVGVRFRGALVV